jgi:inhibitor of cysteine peptidase
MRKIWLLSLSILLVAGAMLLSGCGGSKTVEMVNATGTEVKVGQEFTITLESNRTTGFQWQLAKPLDESVVRLVSSNYQAPTTNAIGAGGKEIWTFKAVGAGKAEIALEYVQPWEQDVDPAIEQTYTITIKK